MVSKTLVTGGAGFIGSHLVEELLNRGEQVVVLDDLSTGKLENLPEHPNLTFLKGSVADPSLVNSLFKEYPISSVFHLAAVASVQKSVESPVDCHEVNFDGTLYLMEAARRSGVSSFVFASSAAVYGDEPTLPKTEETPVKPITPYAVDKYASERYVVNGAALYGFPGVALRFFNVFGERQDPSSPYSGVISIFVDRIKRFLKGEPVKIVVFGDGRQTRDFVYVKDVVSALFLARDKAPKGEVYNVGTGREVSLLEMLETLKELVGTLPPVEFAPPRPGDIRRSVASIEKLKGLGYRPRWSFKEGLKSLLKSEKVIS